MDNHLQYHICPDIRTNCKDKDVISEYDDYSASVELYDDIARKVYSLVDEGVVDWNDEKYPKLTSWLLSVVPKEYYDILYIGYDG